MQSLLRAVILRYFLLPIQFSNCILPSQREVGGQGSQNVILLLPTGFYQRKGDRFLRREIGRLFPK